uniref:Uncharacterized protein n=1 Tax=Anguilla anguilla TaxID=7936 RepID=A0A0E9QRB9_ANGAN
MQTTSSEWNPCLQVENHTLRCIMVLLTGSSPSKATEHRHRNSAFITESL